MPRNDLQNIRNILLLFNLDKSHLTDAINSRHACSKFRKTNGQRYFINVATCLIAHLNHAQSHTYMQYEYPINTGIELTNEKVNRNREVERAWERTKDERSDIQVDMFISFFYSFTKLYIL